MYENEVSLPLHTLLTDEQVEYIISSLKAKSSNKNKNKAETFRTEAADVFCFFCRKSLMAILF